MFKIEYSNKSLRFLDKCEKNLCERIIDKIEKLKETSVPNDAKFIGRHKGDKVFRVRIGDYRVLYKIKDEDKVILIINIDKRPRIY